MKKQTAVAVMDDVKQILAKVSHLMDFIDEYGEPDEVRELKRGLASVVFAIEDHLIQPVTREHPEIDPTISGSGN